MLGVARNWLSGYPGNANWVGEEGGEEGEVDYEGDAGEEEIWGEEVLVVGENFYKKLV